jgi:undecaprenyl-diphosphatase
VTVLQAIILGLVQGATEYAPVSSSGHLILVPWIFDWSILGDPELNKTFDVALHMGTLLGAVIYFRRDIVAYARAWLGSVHRRRISTTDERLAWAIVIGTIPGVIVGALFADTIEQDLGQPWLIATMLAIFGVVLYVVDRVCGSDRTLDSIGPRTGLALGSAQALALQPGISRSGITMTAARLLGIEREAAARFSFLLSLPIIAGAGLFKGLDLLQSGFQGYGSQFFWGFVSSAVSGFLVIAWLLKYLRGHSFALFMWYRLAVAALCFGLIATGARPATI